MRTSASAPTAQAIDRSRHRRRLPKRTIDRSIARLLSVPLFVPSALSSSFFNFNSTRLLSTLGWPRATGGGARAVLTISLPGCDSPRLLSTLGWPRATCGGARAVLTISLPGCQSSMLAPRRYRQSEQHLVALAWSGLVRPGRLVPPELAMPALPRRMCRRPALARYRRPALPRCPRSALPRHQRRGPVNWRSSGPGGQGSI